MEFSSSAAMRRRAASVVSSGMLRLAALVLIGIAGTGWSGGASAQSCDFVATSATSQTNAPGTSVSFTLEAQGACSLTVDISLAIAPGDTTGGSTIQPPTSATIPRDTAYPFTVDLGPTPGGTGTVIATCLNGGCAGDTISFVFATTNLSYTPLGGITAITADVLTPFTFGTHFEANGSPSTAVSSQFSNLTTTANYGTVVPDANGDAQTTQSIPTPNTYNLRATPVCPTAFVLPGCSALQPIDYVLTVEPVGVTAVSATPVTLASGASTTLTAYYGSASFPRPDGTTLTWSVTQPAGGDGVVTGNPVAGGAGESDALFTATVPGTYTVNAFTGCTFCSPNNASFSVVVTAVPYTLAAVTPDPATGNDGDPIVFTVALDQGGTPVVGGTISWAAGGPFTPGTATSATDAAGHASATFTPNGAGTFTNVVTAEYDPDGIPANGDEVQYVFDATIAALPTLAIQAGDGQTVQVGTAYPIDLSVVAQNSGLPAGGVTILWNVIGGTATVVDNGPTDFTGGAASATVTPTSAGPITITATRQDAPGASVTFNLTATALPYGIVAVSPNPATGTVGTGVAFTVAVDQGGTPVVGGTVNFAAHPDFSPATSSAITDTNGQATVTLLPSTAGAYPTAVNATYDPDGIPANGDEVAVVFGANIAAVPTLAINGGNGQSTTVGSPFPAVLSVIAQDSGVPAVGVVIDWVVTAGTANITPSGPTDGTGEAHLSVTPTAPGPITVTATRQDAPSVSVTFNLTATATPYGIVAVSANPATGNVGDPMVFSVVVDQGGTPVAGGTVQFVAGAPFAPGSANVVTDAAGSASATFTPSAAGAFTGVVSATYDPDGIPANGDEVAVSFDANIAAVATLAINGGNGQSTTVGTTFPVALSVVAQDSGVPAVGVVIDWVVAGGSATVVPGGPTDGTGQATASVTPTAAGPITITATRQDAPGATVTFNLTATALPKTLTAVSPNPASGTVGAPVAFAVRLEQAGVAQAGATVTWTATAPFTPASASTVTDAAGNASTTFTPSAAGAFTGAVTATYDGDGIPANGDELTVVFDANITSVATLAIASGNGQSALPGATFAAPLQVLAENSGVPAAGVGITWVVTGDAAIAPSGVTDGAGLASATLTAGSTSGPVTVTATRQDAPGASVTFSLTVSALGALAITEGDGQRLTAGVPSAPLRVRLTDGGGAPIAGATVAWATSAGALANPTSVTDAAGVASNTVTTATAGAVQVTASSPLAAAPAVFDLDGGMSNLTGLDAVQQEVVEAIDNLCPALRGLATRTAAQNDLLARCEELTDAAGVDPTAAIAAVDELMTDVALAQGNSALIALQTQFQNLKVRIAALRSGTRGVSFGGLAVNTPTGAVSLETLSSAFAAQDPEPAATGGSGEAGADFDRWGFFAAGTLGRGEQDPGDVNPEFDYDINGVTAGFDYRKSDSLIFGGAFGYTRQDTDLPDGAGGVDTSGWTLSGYGTYYTKDSWYADGVLTFGRNDYDLTRHIDYTVPLAGGGTSTITQTARASAGGDLFQGAFTVGRDFNRGALGIGPYAKLMYTRIGFDSIEEETEAGVPGEGLGLRIEARELTSLASVIGGKLTYTHSTEWGVLMPHLQLEWEHEFKDDPQEIEASFLHDPTGSEIFVRGDRLDTDYFRLGLGLSMVLSGGRSGFFYYEHLLSRDGISQWNLALGLRMEF